MKRKKDLLKNRSLMVSTSQVIDYYFFWSFCKAFTIEVIKSCHSYTHILSSPHRYSILVCFFITNISSVNFIFIICSGQVLSNAALVTFRVSIPYSKQPYYYQNKANKNTTLNTLPMFAFHSKSDCYFTSLNTSNRSCKALTTS